MKTKFYTVSRRLAGSVMTMLAALALSATATAATVDWGAMELDKEYEMASDFSNYEGYFVAPSTGTLTVKNTNAGGKIGVYSDAEHTTQIGTWASPNTIVSVTEGTTYYFYKKFSMNANVVTLTMGQKMEVTFYPEIVYPDRFSIAGDGTVTMKCNMAPAWDKITISSKGNEAEVSGTIRQTSYVEIAVKSVLEDWYKKGLVEANDYVKITVSGLRSATDASVIYGEDGTASVSYCLAGAPTNLVSMITVDGNTSLNVNGGTTDYVVYSYFTAGDESAIFHATFDQALDTTTGSGYITFGNQEGSDGEYYTETIPLTFINDNKTAVLDLTGKSRRLQELVSSGTNYANMTVSLSHLKDANGSYINTTTTGSSGTITWNVTYQELAGDIKIYYMPDGMDLTNEQYAEAYVVNYENLIWSGVSLATKTLYRTFTKDQLTIETDNYGGAYIQTPLDDETRKAKNLVFTITDAESRTGQDLSTIATCVYNPSSTEDPDPTEPEVTYVSDLNIVSSPAKGEFVESCTQVSLKFADYDVAAWDLEAGVHATIQKQGGALNEITSDDDYALGTDWNQLILKLGDKAAVTGSYLVTIPKGLVILDDEGYVRNEEFSLSFVVDVPTTYYKDLNITSTPANGAEVEKCEQINIIFNDFETAGADNNIYATIQRDGGDAVTCNDYEFGTAWNEMIVKLGTIAQQPGTYTVTFPKGVFIFNDDDKKLSDEFSLTFTVKDATADEELTYEILPDNTNPVSEIFTMSVKFNKTITSVDTESLAQIGVSKDNEIVHNFTVDTDVWTGLDTEMFTIIFDTPLKDNGRYIISLPEGLVKFGNVSSPAIMVTYVISNVTELTTVDVTSVPAHQSTVASCDRVYLTFNDFGACNASYLVQPTITREGGSAVTLGNPEWGVELNQVELDLKGNAKEYGTYTVNFPKGCILLGIDEDDSNPVDNPAFDITFTVSGETGVGTITVDNSEVRYYNLQGVEVKNPANGVYIKVQGTTVSKVTL